MRQSTPFQSNVQQDCSCPPSIPSALFEMPPLINSSTLVTTEASTLLTIETAQQCHTCCRLLAPGARWVPLQGTYPAEILQSCTRVSAAKCCQCNPCWQNTKAGELCNVRILLRILVLHKGVSHRLFLNQLQLNMSNSHEYLHSHLTYMEYSSPTPQVPTMTTSMLQSMAALTCSLSPVTCRILR